MTGISFQIDSSDITAALLKIAPIVDFDPLQLMSEIGSMGESQTRRRIAEEKTGPDGTPWLPNTQGTSILMKSGQHLLGYMTFNASDDMAEWGSSWPYAHVHQDGMTIIPKQAGALAFKLGDKMVVAQKVTIPARPYLGLSEENRTDIEQLVTDMLGLLK